MTEGIAALFWILALVGAYPYVQSIKHPALKPLAAYLIFILVFSVVAGSLFAGLSALIILTVGPDLLTQVWAATLFILIVFAPAVFAARWFVKRPPKDAPPL